MPLITRLPDAQPRTVVAPPRDEMRIETLSERIIRESHDAFFALSSLRRPLHKQIRLLPKLADESLADDPAFIRANLVSIDLDREMGTLLTTIASSESDAERAWMQLQPDDREEAAEWWNADPEQPSLIGHTFSAWPECEIPDDFVPGHLSRILRNVFEWSSFDDWRRKGVLTR